MVRENLTKIQRREVKNCIQSWYWGQKVDIACKLEFKRQFTQWIFPGDPSPVKVEPSRCREENDCLLLQ